MDIVNFPVFAVAVLALHAIPGPDSLYVMGRSISQGTTAGMLAALGIMGGCIVHTLISAFGFAALLATVPGFFDIIRALGATYLIYQGVKLILSKADKTARLDTQPAELSKLGVFSEALLTNLLNPKVVLFYLAFFPQFVAADGLHKTAAYLALGGFFAVTAGLWALGLAIVAGKVIGKLDNQGRFTLVFKRAVGTLFAVLGVRLIL
ncbi:LysE family translocator [Pseudomonas sp. 2FE]|uniref:LysE family translocator n=1 Tax=Pseudomonas sp. 2FE TaxID=2502190 RepID=UPI0010F6EDFC|nr:LysE family translocator [Pseudomonas sp. 2FE]